MKASALLLELSTPQGRWPLRRWALLDVREAAEAEAGHIPFATSLPRRQIEYRLRCLLPERATWIILTDAGQLSDGSADRRAERAARTMAAMGYGNVAVLEGGLSAWIGAGGALATGTNVPSKIFGEGVLKEDAVPTITADELGDLIEAGRAPTLCDVRTEEEFAHHHLPQARSTPGFDLALDMPAFGSGDDLVINCAGRTRSIIATATARRLGATKARALENGTMGWRLSGRTLAAGAPETGEGRAEGVDAALLDRARALGTGAGLGRTGVKELAALRRTGAGPVLLDLRPLAEFSSGHIPGAIAVPGGQSIQRTDDFLLAPGLPLVLCDGGELRSALAGYWLRRMGLPEVTLLTGGFGAWQAAGLEVERGRHGKIPLPDPAPGISISAQEWAGRDRASPPADVVLDLRPSREYRAGHLPGAVWAPRGWLETIVAVWQGSGTRLLLIGRDETEARLGAAQLDAEGIAPLVLCGGMAAWRAASLPEEIGLPPDARWLPDLVAPPYVGPIERMRDYLNWEVALHDAHGDGKAR